MNPGICVFCSGEVAFSDEKPRRAIAMETTNLKKTTRVTLKTIAEKVGLTPGTISAVLNNTRAAERIPQHTRDRVITAAREMNYQPNPLARALRTGHPISNSHAGEFSAARGALVIVGTHQFERALTAIQQAGLRVPDDVSVLDFFDVPAAWEHPRFASAPDYPSLEAAEAS
jgi:DNA-binding LacI/PurR family transcriptional regulator